MKKVIITLIWILSASTLACDNMEELKNRRTYVSNKLQIAMAIHDTAAYAFNDELLEIGIQLDQCLTEAEERDEEYPSNEPESEPEKKEEPKEAKNGDKK